MKDEVTTRLCTRFARIKSIPESKQEQTLQRLGLLFQEAFEFSDWALDELLLAIAHAKCTPPLPEDDVARIARNVFEEVERNWGRLMSGIVCFGNIPAEEIEAVKRTIEALPYAQAYCFADGDAKSPYWREALAKLQGTLFDDEIDEICGDTSDNPNVFADNWNGGQYADKYNTAFEELIASAEATSYLGVSEDGQTEQIPDCKPSEVLLSGFDNMPEGELEEAKKMLTALPFVSAVGFTAPEDATLPNLQKLLASMQSDLFGAEPASSAAVPTDK